ncbi:MAG: histidine kinase [Aliidongia sp.]
MLTAQEAERKDLARDLHDDIGPLLLAVSIDAAAAEGMIAADAPDAVPALRSIGETVGEAQQHIRAIVNRLRPIGLAEFGLCRAVENLAAFWQRRHPAGRLRPRIGRGLRGLGRLAEITAFRIVQEALNNALRHGEPSQIRIAFRFEADGAFAVEISDDGRGAGDSKPVSA